MSFADFVRRLFRGSRPLRPADANPASSEDETITRWQKALTDLGFPHSIVAGQQAEAALDAERQTGLREGFSPVIIVPGLWVSTPMTASERAQKARELPLESYDAAFGKTFLQRKFAQLTEDLKHDPECLDPTVFDRLEPVKPMSFASGLSLLRKYNAATAEMEPVPEVAIMRIPTTDSHTIPVILDWGGWNAVPTSPELAAVSRYWGETHGARLAAVGSDTLEFSVARKPETHAAAVALLKEQYCFAPDNWEDDEDVLAQAAAELLVRDSWFFWWD